MKRMLHSDFRPTGRLVLGILSLTVFLMPAACKKEPAPIVDPCAVLDDTLEPRFIWSGSDVPLTPEIQWTTAVRNAALGLALGPEGAPTGWCSATAIAPHYALTAAHCVNGLLSTPQNGVLAVGPDARNAEITFHIAEAVPHPDYPALAYEADIAILRTVEDMSVGGHVAMVSLPSEAIPAVDEPGPDPDQVKITVGGYGTDNTQSGYKHYADFYVYYASEYIFAANAFPTVCGGDSGSGAWSADPTGYPVIVGITVAQGGGGGCADPSSYGLFNAVYPKTGWIRQVTGIVEPDCTAWEIIGSCNGNMATYCDDGTIVNINCGALSGGRCGENHEGRMRCVPVDALYDCITAG